MIILRWLTLPSLVHTVPHRFVTQFAAAIRLCIRKRSLAPRRRCSVNLAWIAIERSHVSTTKPSQVWMLKKLIIIIYKQLNKHSFHILIWISMIIYWMNQVVSIRKHISDLKASISYTLFQQCKIFKNENSKFLGLNSKPIQE